MTRGVETRVVPVVGVTFKNEDGSKRQDILEELSDRYGNDVEILDVELEQYLYQGDPAYHVIIDGRIVGNLNNNLAKEIYLLKEEKSYSVWVDSAWIVGGGESYYDENEKLNYGARLKLCLASPEESKRISDQIKETIDANDHGYTYCHHCGEKVFEEAIICPKCGANLTNNRSIGHKKSIGGKSKEQRRIKGTYKLVIAGIFIIWGLCFFASSTIKMVALMLISLPFILWWIATDMHIDSRE